MKQELIDGIKDIIKTSEVSYDDKSMYLSTLDKLIKEGNNEDIDSAAINILNDNITQLKETIRYITVQNSNVFSDYYSKQEKCDTLKLQLDNLGTINASQAKEIIRLISVNTAKLNINKFSNYMEQISNVNTKLDTANAKVKQLTNDFESYKLNTIPKELRDLKLKFLQKCSDLTNITKELTALDEDYAILKKKYDTSVDRYIKLDTDHTKLKDDYDALNCIFNSTLKDYSDCEEDSERLTDALKDANELYRKVKGELVISNNQINDLQKRLKLITNERDDWKEKYLKLVQS